MIRELAGYDVDRYAAVSRWPLSEALIAFESALRRQAREQFRHEQALYAAGCLKAQPTVPPILAAATDPGTHHG